MDLMTLEDIRRLKYRYLRCVDLKLWDELAGTLTEDAVADYRTRAVKKPLRLEGRQEIVSYLRENMGPGITTAHFASQPEIDIDGDYATGTWGFEDTVIATEYRVIIQGAAYYNDEYRRGADGAWRIASTGYERTYEYMVSMDDTPSLRMLRNRWAAEE